MTVFVLLDDIEYEGDRLLGVFSTREAAEAAWPVAQGYGEMKITETPLGEIDPEIVEYNRVTAEMQAEYVAQRVEHEAAQAKATDAKRAANYDAYYAAFLKRLDESGR